jgi:hypothetical protein
MNTAASSSDALRAVFRRPTGGIAGLVDDLLTTCRDHGLALDWQAGHLRLRSPGGDWHELRDVPLRKSALRAVLARLAVLCNERRPGSCSPYGGRGEIAVGSNPATTFHVVFTNTPGEQRLELTHDRPGLKPLGGTIMSTDVAGHPMLAGLLAAVPRLRTELPGWIEGHLLPALDGFPDGAGDAQIDTALVNLRRVLRGRADIDRWLGDIANLGTGGRAGALRSMTPDSALEQRVPLTHEPRTNRTVVEQARQLREALMAAPDKATDPPPPQPRQDAK